ncbi:MAG: glycosyltransferase family 9 protein [Fusobacteriaceae bacterium]
MDIKKIIVSRTDKIGDLILSIPSFFMLRKMYPKAEITVLVRKYNYEIVKNLSYIDRVVKIDDYTQKELLKKIGYFKADLFIALYSDSFIGKLAKASGAKYRIGPYSKISSFFSYNGGVFQKRSFSKKNEAEYNLDLIRKIDSKLYDEKFIIDTEIVLSDENREIAEKFLKNNRIEGKLLVINPFMGGSAKNIRDEEYTSLMEKLCQRDPELNIIVTAHISDEKRMEKLLCGLEGRKIYPFLNGGDLLNTAGVIEKADVYFGGSTGPTHIAASLRRKIVAIYPAKKTQSPLRWGVFGDVDVTYLIPDEKNKKENYKHKYFESYTSAMEEELIEIIEKKLRSNQ